MPYNKDYNISRNRHYGLRIGRRKEDIEICPLSKPDKNFMPYKFVMFQPEYKNKEKIMKKYLMLWFVILFLVKCGDIETKRQRDLSSNFDKVCIENHIYYFTGNGFLAIKLNDDGKPVKCGGKK